ncbi:hypothetical protein CWI53_11125, partial [Neisseria meningitidis]|uniref:hypothetical protein n=1 Tax=Neisseria meningitidis TaxID=487 RepID=UPI000CB2917B
EKQNTTKHKKKKEKQKKKKQRRKKKNKKPATSSCPTNRSKPSFYPTTQAAEQKIRGCPR